MAISPAALAQTLVARHRDQRAREQDRGRELLSLLLQQGVELIRNAHAQRAWLIGSLAAGHFGTGSDVDLVVEGLSLERWPELWAQLGDLLGVEIDLLRIEELPDAFQERVRREGRVLHVT